MANDSVRDTLDILLVDLLRLEGSLPDLGVANGRGIVINDSARLRWEVRACYQWQPKYATLPVSERWCCLGRRGVFTGWPI